jgi:flagellar motor protein MotB
MIAALFSLLTPYKMMKPEKSDSTDSPEWMISYSDLMSLLLCFFVMLYAISTVQETKLQSATESLRSGFGLFGNANSAITSGKRAIAQKVGGTILFDRGSDDLADSAKQELDEIYRQLLGTTNKIQIVGQAGFGEPSAYRRELDLAYSRAISVWDYLVSLGISRERCEIVQQANESAAARVEVRSVK